MKENYNVLSTGRDTMLRKKRKNGSILLGLFSVMLFLFNGVANAQVTGYTFNESTETYTQVVGTVSTASTNLTGDDGIQGPTAIGFNFVFDGTTYTQFSHNTNGLIKLGGTTIGGSGWVNSLGNSATHRPLIAAFWDDNHQGTGSIQYLLSGSAPNRVFEIGFHNVNIGGSGSTSATNFASYKIRLFETTNVIEFVYGPTMASAGALSASIGLNGASTFLSVTPAATSTTSSATANNSISSTANLVGKRFRFTPPPPPNCGAPQALAVTDITATTADIAWSAPLSGTAATYDWEIRTTGVGGSGGVGLTTSGSTTAPTVSVDNVPGLTAKTIYNLYVRTNCSGGDGSSTWAGPFNFSTTLNCAAAIVLTSATPVTSGNLAVAGGAYNVGSCGFTTPGNEALYSYTAPVTGSYTLNISNINGGFGFIDYFFKDAALGCGNSGWVCIDDNSAVGTDPFTLTGGVTYFILLDAESAASTANHTFSIVTPPICNGAIGGTTSANVSSCGATTPTITASGYSFGTVSTYQWEYSNDNFVADIHDFIGQNNPASLTTGSVSVTTYYRLRVTCDTGVATAYSNVVTVSIFPTASATVAAGGGTFCSSATITATNGGDAPIYFQGTNPTGNSTATPSASEVVTASGTYYFVTITPNGCIGTAGSVTVVIQQPASITGTPASVCQGGSGMVSASDANNCSGFEMANGFSGVFTLADAQATRPTTSINNTPTCSFSPVGPGSVRGYQSRTFQVSVTGNYVLGMSTVDDGMAYITTGAFTPGSCATGTWIMGDDDANGSLDPRLTVTLTSGVDYTLYSTTWSNTADGNSTAAYTWTVNTAPVGGQLMFPFSGNLEWYTAASGGSAIATGGSFDPTVTAGSGLTNTNTPGTTTYYVACSSSSACRVPVDFVINPATTNNSATVAAFGSYTWAAPAGNGMTYTASGVYTYTTTDVNGCTNIATLTLTISPIVNSFVIGSSCGSMVNNLAVTVITPAVSGVSTYMFRVTNVATSASFIVTRPVNSFALGNYATVTYNTQYQVEVSTNGGTTWGPPCAIFTPNPTSTIGAQCGTTLTAMNQFVYATAVSGIGGYRFRVTNVATSGSVEYTALSGLNRFSFSQLSPAFATFGTTYSVEVALRNTDGSYLPYGSACNITTPAFPTSEIILSQCDMTAMSNTQTINVMPVSGATGYRIQLVNSGLPYDFSLDRTLANFNLSMFPGLTPGTTYTARVAVRINGVWGPLTGKPCTITTPGDAPIPARMAEVNTTFAAIAYPNPFAENFMFDVKTSAQSSIQIRVYDMLGKQVENRNVEASEINNVQFGDAYPSGVYNVIVTQGENTQNVRVIKR